MPPRRRSLADAPRPCDTAASSGPRRIPYYSSKPGRNPEVRLNQQAYFAGHEGNDDELIECRHLAVAWLRRHETGAGKPDYRDFESEEAITRNVPRSEETVYDALTASAQSDLHLIKVGDWGRFAAERFREMESKGVDSLRMLVESTMHTMAAEFKIKREPGQPPRYVQKVYDPNSTLTHKRSSTSDLRDVEQGLIKDYLKHEDLSLVYFGSSAMLVRTVPEGGLANLQEVPAGGPVDRRAAGDLPALDDTVMYFLLADGFGGSLRDLKPAILQMAQDDPDGATELLAACNIDEDTGLYAAVTKGMADATAAFCEIVRDCRLDTEQKVELLAAQDGDGTPALYMGMQQGHAESSRALMAGIIGSGLELRERVKLLIAPSPDGDAGLSMAMQLGRHQCVGMLIEALERSDFPPPVVAALLQGPRADGRPAPVPALAHGMRQDQVDAVRALVQGIASSTKLNAVQKHHLMCARNEQGQRALSAAMQSGQARSVATFVEVVAGSDLPLGARRDLLLSLGTNGEPALAAALGHEQGGSVRAYAEALLSSALPAPLKLELLRAERQGSTVYGAALAQGCESVATALREVVGASSLSPQEKSLVLDDAARRRRIS